MARLREISLHADRIDFRETDGMRLLEKFAGTPGLFFRSGDAIEFEAHLGAGQGLASRWYPDTIMARLREISLHADRIDFRETDGMRLLEEFAGTPAPWSSPIRPIRRAASGPAGGSIPTTRSTIHGCSNCWPIPRPISC